MEIDPKYKYSWRELGLAGGGVVKGTSYTEVQCYTRALEIDPSFQNAWISLGNAGGGVVEGKAFSAAECKELGKDPSKRGELGTPVASASAGPSLLPTAPPSEADGPGDSLHGHRARKLPGLRIHHLGVGGCAVDRDGSSHCHSSNPWRPCSCGRGGCGSAGPRLGPTAAVHREGLVTTARS